MGLTSVCCRSVNSEVLFFYESTRDKGMLTDGTEAHAEGCLSPCKARDKLRVT